MKSKFRYYTFSLFVLLLNCAVAQDSQKVSQAEVKLLELNGSKTQVQVTISPEPHWHVYWINPGDAGAFLTLEASQGKVELVKASIPQRFSHQGLITYGYEQPASFIYEMTNVNSAEALTIKADYLLCNSVRCIPKSIEQKLTLSPPRKKDAVATPVYHYPKTEASIKFLKTSESKGSLTYFWDSPQDLSGWQVFPLTESLREPEKGSLVEKTGKHYSFTLEVQGEQPKVASFLIKKDASYAVLIESTL